MKWGLLAVAVAVSAAAGCNESFECAADSHCERDGVAGFCESVGHCSFPDEDCETGRRFGELAGTLSNMCVPPSEEATTGSVSSTGSAESSSSASPGSTTDLPGATTEQDPSSSSGGQDESSSGTPMSSDCNILFEDTFAGDALAETWSVIGEPPTVSAGALRYFIEPESAAGYPSVSVLAGTPLNLSDGWVTANLEAVPQILRTQGTLIFDIDGYESMVLYEAGGIRVFVDNESLEDTGTTAPWVRFALESTPVGNDLAFYESEDGEDWVEVARAVSIPADPTAVRVSVRAGAYDDFAIPQEFALKSIEVCGRSGL